ncbi:MAG TPA: HEAT repeat domain-containing protein [Polyangiaceae bacterium]
MPTSASGEATEVDQQIHRLLAPSGDPQYRRVRGEALQWLLARADQAYPKLRAIVDVPAPPALAIAALAEFQRADSVAVLERLLHEADDPTVVAAADALASLHAPEALAALERGLGNKREQVVASSADGLGHRGDPAACAALAATLGHPNAEVRGRVKGASARLGCKHGT